MAMARVFFDNREIPLPLEWETVIASLNKLKGGNGHSLFLEGQNGFEMNVVYVRDLGFYVSTLGEGDGERIASDRSLPRDCIHVVIADEQQVPRNLLISPELTERIVREFYDAGKRSTAAEWVDPFEVIE